MSKPDGEDGCWVWTQSRESRGYGAFKFEGQHYKAHRVSYEIHNDVMLEPGTKIRHRCDNPPCVNPSHLSPGSQAENIDDMVQRNRFSAKLTIEQVVAIRTAYGSGTGVAELAAKHTVSKTSIRSVVGRKTWKHV